MDSSQYAKFLKGRAWFWWFAHLYVILAWIVMGVINYYIPNSAFERGFAGIIFVSIITGLVILADLL